MKSCSCLARSALLPPVPIILPKLTNLYSSQDAPPNDLPPTVTWVKTDYTNLDELTKTLRGVDTVLSFITAHMDPGSVAQKTLVDAAVRAGVRRFAPSEWASYVFLFLRLLFCFGRE